MMKVFVTGANGFIGSKLVKKLRKRKHTVIDCDLYGRNICNFQDLVEQMKGDVVVHLAARVKAGQSLKIPRQYIETNVMGLTNVLEAIRLKRIPRIIFTSSVGVKDYRREPIPYLWSKRIGELLIEMYSRAYGIESIILRPANIYGAGNNKGIVYLFMKAKKEGRTLQIFGSGLQTRDFVYIDDIVNAIVKSVEMRKMPKKRLLYAELGTGKETTMLELAKKISDNYVLVPLKNEDVGLKQSYADITNAEKYLKWKAKITLDEGLKRLEEGMEDE